MTGRKSHRNVRFWLGGVVAVLAMSVQAGPLALTALGASPPVIESVGVSEVTDSNAVLSAVIDPVEGGAYYQFQIAIDSSELASEILCPENPGTDAGPLCEGTKAKGALPIGELWGEVQSVELDLNDAGVILQPESTYYFRVLAVRAADEEEDEAIEWEEPIVVGETSDFTTGGIGGEPSVPPVLAVPQSNPSSLIGHSLLLRPEEALPGPAETPARQGDLRQAQLLSWERGRRGAKGQFERKPCSPKGVVLLIDDRQVRAGERAYARLANFRDADVAYRHAFSIERWTKGGWERDPNSPDGPWPKSMDRLAPGEAGKCYVFDVPREQPAGRYRFSATDVQLKPLTKFSLTWESASFRVKR